MSHTMPNGDSYQKKKIGSLDGSNLFQMAVKLPPNPTVRLLYCTFVFDFAAVNGTGRSENRPAVRLLAQHDAHLGLGVVYVAMMLH